MKKAVKFLAVLVVVLVSNTFVSCVEEEPEYDLKAEYEKSLPNFAKSEEFQHSRLSMCVNYRIISIKDSKGLELLGTPKVADQLGNMYDFGNKVITIVNGAGTVVSKTDYVVRINATEAINYRNPLFPFELITNNRVYKNFTYVPLTAEEKSSTLGETGYYDLFVRKVTFTVSVNNEDLTYVLITADLRK